MSTLSCTRCFGCPINQIPCLREVRDEQHFCCSFLLLQTATSLSLKTIRVRAFRPDPQDTQKLYSDASGEDRSFTTFLQIGVSTVVHSLNICTFFFSWRACTTSSCSSGSLRTSVTRPFTTRNVGGSMWERKHGFSQKLCYTRPRRVCQSEDRKDCQIS